MITLKGKEIYTMHRGNRLVKYTFILACMLGLHSMAWGQRDAQVSARMDATQITAGDQVRVFLEVHHNKANTQFTWPAIADTFVGLEVVEKGKIDTVANGDEVTYKQRLLITGFDSGLFRVPAFQFAFVPKGDSAYVLLTDSFMLSVQSVAVDTTQAFKPIKNILFVKSSWRDYLWFIIGGIVLVAGAIWGTWYYMRHRKPTPKPVFAGPVESLQDKCLRELNELETQNLWQKGQVKEYYVGLTDIVRGYIEQRFQTPAMELTTDELLYKAQFHRELQPYITMLTVVLQTADLAKFAKWQPLPQEHFDAIAHARQLIESSRPIIKTETSEKTI